MKPQEPLPTADEALQRLIDGNLRFLRGEARFPTVQKEILADLAQGQWPYATSLGCSDSRVPPELIFDAGFGELFIVRVAGNVLSPEIMGSLQYAGLHLHAPRFVVLGHSGCGAVRAALETQRHGLQHRARIQILIDSILPGLPDLDPRLPPSAQLDRAVEANVRMDHAATSGNARRASPHGRGANETRRHCLRVRQAIRLDRERTFEQDPKYLLRLLVDIAIKALSPAINDPTTAVQAIDQIEDLLRRLGRRMLDAGCVADEQGVLRLVFPTPTWEDYLTLAFDEIRQFGATSVQVMRRLRSALVGLMDSVTEAERKAVVRRYLHHLNLVVEHSVLDAEDQVMALQEDRQGLGLSRRRAEPHPNEIP